MSIRRRKHGREAAELEITSFMNLMIILVPVLLVMMVFSRITVIELDLPDFGDPSQTSPDLIKKLEVVISKDAIAVNYPAGIQVKSISKKAGKHDFALLSQFLQQVKRTLQAQGQDKRDILILSQPDTDYQVLVSTIDAVRSYKTVVVTDVVDAVLFPDIALGDAPLPRRGRP